MCARSRAYISSCPSASAGGPLTKSLPSSTSAGRARAAGAGLRERLVHELLRTGEARGRLTDLLAREEDHGDVAVGAPELAGQRQTVHPRQIDVQQGKRRPPEADQLQCLLAGGRPPRTSNSSAASVARSSDRNGASSSTTRIRCRSALGPSWLHAAERGAMSAAPSAIIGAIRKPTTAPNSAQTPSTSAVHSTQAMLIGLPSGASGQHEKGRRR